MSKKEGQTQTKPNILVIWGDDIGWFNISANNNGIMGYRTPNIDRIAKEGCLFTDWYGQQSCTAGRAAFITGQSPIRTGLTKVGLPGADRGHPEQPGRDTQHGPLGACHQPEHPGVPANHAAIRGEGVGQRLSTVYHVLDRAGAGVREVHRRPNPFTGETEALAGRVADDERIPGHRIP